jgi:hypothetical protein
MGKGRVIYFTGEREDVKAIPTEFKRLPKLLPPNIADVGNPDRLWKVCEAWHSPPIDGMVAHVREPVKLVGGGEFGFYTDGISVPQLAWTIFGLQPFSMPELCAALGHDMVYSGELVPRSDCDKWIKEWCRLAGVSAARRNVIYKCVNSFGGWVWKKHTPETILAARALCQVTKVGQDPVWGPLPEGLVASVEL